MYASSTTEWWYLKAHVELADGRTDLDNLALLCVPHHQQVDLNRWTLTANPSPTTGKHWTVTKNRRSTWRNRQ